MQLRDHLHRPTQRTTQIVDIHQTIRPTSNRTNLSTQVLNPTGLSTSTPIPITAIQAKEGFANLDSSFMLRRQLQTQHHTSSTWMHLARHASQVADARDHHLIPRSDLITVHLSISQPIFNLSHQVDIQEEN